MKVRNILFALSVMAVLPVFLAPSKAQIKPDCDPQRCQTLFAAYKWERHLCGKCEQDDVECIKNDLVKCREIFFQDPNNKKYCGGCTFTNYNW